MVRVLIADDSTLVRLVLRDLLGRDPEIEIVAEVRDGAQAVEETRRLRPDLILMDVRMPVLDGLAAISEIMADCPTPILVLSASIQAGASQEAFEAIRHGALDVLAKPQGITGEAFEAIAGQLIEKVKTLARVRVIHHFRRRKSASPFPPSTTEPRDLLAIGASTGGPPAVLRLLKDLPAETGARVLIVQHIASGFAAGFAEWLDRETPLQVRLARSGDELLPGMALVAPSEAHLEIRGGRVHLTPGATVNSCRPSVDVLFHSLALSPLAARTAAVLLTGMGRDGAEGLAALRRRGAYTIAQDEGSCAIFGMPRAAIELGAVIETLSLNDIPSRLLVLLRR